MTRGRIAAGYVVGIAGYVLGLVISALSDWPSGPAIVWVMTALAIGVFALGPRSRGTSQFAIRQ
jgi:zinc/manganese transport system permease protein